VRNPGILRCAQNDRWALCRASLGNLRRRAVLPTRRATWQLASPQLRLVKTGGRLVERARYYRLLLAKSHLRRRRFADLLAKIAMLSSPPL
jgi:hypothetical protein